MSYTRKYKDEINEIISKRIRVRAIASANGNPQVYVQVDGREYNYGSVSSMGKSKNIDVQAQIPVKFEITVDTNPFDRGLAETNQHVELLTESVVLTEAAQIQAKIKSAEDISNAVVRGFFGLIKSEINQQISEIKPRVESLLVEMHHQGKACLEKKDQLAGDFERITERYTKIFMELDKELRKRISLLNQSAITLQESLAQRMLRSFSEPGMATATVFHREGSSLHTDLFSSGTKERALALLHSSRDYLQAERQLNRQLRVCLLPLSLNANITQYVPVIYFATRSGSDQADARLFCPEALPAIGRKETQLMRAFERQAPTGTTADTSRLEEHMDRLFRQHEFSLPPRTLTQIRQLWEQHHRRPANQ
jgi:hypothetical protein